ncbi:hypothetical protein KJ758_00840 [Patescibacteria group bacterium]|nr:hypothetical protein [Patescibacteria group bacterium]
MFAHVISGDRSSFIIVYGEEVGEEHWRVTVTFQSGSCVGVVRRTISDLTEMDQLLTPLRTRRGWFGEKVGVETLMLVNEAVRRLVINGFGQAFKDSESFRHLLYVDPVATKHPNEE